MHSQEVVLGESGFEHSAGYGRRAGLPDEVKQSVDPVWTGYRKHRGGSEHIVHGTIIHCFFFLLLPR